MSMLIVGVLTLVMLVGGVIYGIQFISEHGVTESVDRTFGDQHLKSAVAMLELHHRRFGQYPDTLKAIKFTGEWDQIWMQGTRYNPSDDRQSYYIEVEQRWIGKPGLTMPDEFWKNTGYDEALRPVDD